MIKFDKNLDGTYIETMPQCCCDVTAMCRLIWHSLVSIACLGNEKVPLQIYTTTKKIENAVKINHNMLHMSNCTADQPLCFHYSDSTDLPLPLPEISRF